LLRDVAEQPCSIINRSIVIAIQSEKAIPISSVRPSDLDWMPSPHISNEIPRSWDLHKKIASFS
jgi:hypothetical protein